MTIYLWSWWVNWARLVNLMTHQVLPLFIFQITNTGKTNSWPAWWVKYTQMSYYNWSYEKYWIITTFLETFETRQASSMIHSARSIVTPVANIVFCCFVFLESGDGRTDGQHVQTQWSLPAVTLAWPSGSIETNSDISFWISGITKYWKKIKLSGKTTSTNVEIKDWKKPLS